jgi:Ca2+-dependent lipid-binding protein
VWVYSARGLKNVDMFGGKSDPYCICMLAEAKQAKKLFQTKVVDNDPDPDWNHGPEQVNLGNGQAKLLFEIYDKDFCRKGDKLGVATVSVEQCLHGLYTDMDLGDGVGTLRVKISPVGPSGEPADVRWTPPQMRPRLQVWVDRAEGLPSADAFGGKSDPFVICSLSEKKLFRTQVINDCNDPVWDHGPEELVLGNEQELQFEVRDRDVIGSDFLGKAALPRAQCVSGFTGRLDLGAGCGILHVRVALAQQSGPEPPPARLEVTILGATALRSGGWFMGSSDPYAVCKLRGKPLFQTKAISNELNPSWDHGPVEVTMGHSERELRFEVYDRNKLGRDTLLGRGGVMREACLAGFEGDVDLGSGSGSLRLRVVPVGVGPASAAAAAAQAQATTTTAAPLSPGTTAATDPNPTRLNSPEKVDAGPKTVVWVFGAKNLRNADMFGGKSDPYCICKLVEDQVSQRAFQTKVINNDPNPQWDHGPEEVAWAGHKELVFEVYDKDLVGLGDKLGEARLSREQCMQGLHTDLPLGEGNGTLCVKIAPMTLQSQPVACGQSPELVVADVSMRGETGDFSVAVGS